MPDTIELHATPNPMNIDVPERRVVITGMGVIAPSGKDIKTFWANVRDGISAAAPVSRFDASRLPVKIAAEVKDFDVSQYINSRKPGPVRSDHSIRRGGGDAGGAGLRPRS